MNRLLRGALIGVASIGTLTGAGAGYLYAALPNAGPVPSVKIEATPERLQRGKYLAENVAICVDCHSTRDWSRFAGPVLPGSEGKGGERFDRATGVPGTVYAPNITPAGIGSYSDGELMRALGSGIAKDGRALFPLMPWQNFRHMCRSDMESVVAYLRTLEPIAGSTPPRELDFPVNVLVRTMPGPAEPWECPEPNDEVAYGKYLATMASCADCHTPMEKGKPIAGMRFAGGTPFGVPTGGVVRSANLTPDEATGIGRWSKQAFVARFAAMRDPNASLPVKAGDFNTIMPWKVYSGMTDRDLGAIWAYLATQTPVRNSVQRFTAQ